MHGVFAAQLRSAARFHKLFSVSRDAYNIVRTSGLRILAEIAGEWRLLTLPSLFEMGLSDCRWVYRTEGRTIAVHAAASAEDAAIQWEIAVEGEPCRFLIFGQLVLGERDFSHAGQVEVDGDAKRFTFRPDPDSLWGKTYPKRGLSPCHQHARRGGGAGRRRTALCGRPAARDALYRGCAPHPPASSASPWLAP